MPGDLRSVFSTPTLVRKEDGVLMIRTTALGLIYLLLLFAFAAGIRSFAGSACSDWLTSCPGTQTTVLEPPDLAPRGEDRRPDEPKLRQ